MIDRRHDLSIARQATVLGISRGSVYYLPRPPSAADLALMRWIDELHLEFPFAGSRMLQGLLRAEGYRVGRRHVATLMKKMGIEALYRRPNTSKPAPGHKIYPYLLRNLPITRPNQVWAMDITYIPMARGFVYLAAVVDWFSRRVLSWRSRWRRTSASRPSRRRWPGTANLTSSTATRARSSRPSTSSRC
jgi:putative transposase